MKKLIKTIDKRQRIGAVYPTKAKTSKNVQTETILKEWSEPEYIKNAIFRFNKEIARLKKQRLDRLKKRKYTGIELKNQSLHFWALRNYAERKQAENDIILQSDVMRLALPRLRGKNTIVKIDFNFQHQEINDDLLALQLIRGARIAREAREAETKNTLKLAFKKVQEKNEFNRKAKEIPPGLRSLHEVKNKLTIEPFDNLEDFFNL